MKKQLNAETIFRDESHNIVGKKEDVFYIKDKLSGEKPVKFKGSWSKCYQLNTPEFSCDNFLAYFIKIIKYLKPGNYVQSPFARRGCCPANTKDMISIVGVSNSVFFRFVSEARKKNILKKVSGEDNGEAYYINPAYYFIGSTMSPTLFAMFIQDSVFRESLSKETLLEWEEIIEMSEKDWSLKMKYPQEDLLDE